MWQWNVIWNKYGNFLINKCTWYKIAKLELTGIACGTSRDQVGIPFSTSWKKKRPFFHNASVHAYVNNAIFICFFSPFVACQSLHVKYCACINPIVVGCLRLFVTVRIPDKIREWVRISQGNRKCFWERLLRWER